ncbi:hypothetical protein [Streptomyces sp. NPDC056056]|uniref:helix-turn-helix transcriptional regulator n=1 Tax=Streptomyces sp. NPDC056056 TaxID=3345698 RepID=UPI0035D9DF56
MIPPHAGPRPESPHQEHPSAPHRTPADARPGTAGRAAGHGPGREHPGEGRPPEDPAAALRVLIHRRQAQLQQESTELKSLRAYVDRLADALPAEPAARLPSEAVERLDTADLAGRVRALLAGAEQEVLVLDRSPHGWGPPGAGGAPALDSRTLRGLLLRGVTVRTLTGREATERPEAVAALAPLRDLGLCARARSGLPPGMVVVDRRDWLPTEGHDRTGTPPSPLSSSPLLRHTALPLFEALWEGAVPVGEARSDLVAEERELLDLLVSGLKDESIARRLGVHVHTVRRRIGRMLGELGADTRFQAGARAAIRGWLHEGPRS